MHVLGVCKLQSLGQSWTTACPVNKILLEHYHALCLHVVYSYLPTTNGREE